MASGSEWPRKSTGWASWNAGRAVRPRKPRQRRRPGPSFDVSLAARSTRRRSSHSERSGRSSFVVPLAGRSRVAGRPRRCLLGCRDDQGERRRVGRSHPLFARRASRRAVGGVRGGLRTADRDRGPGTRPCRGGGGPGGRRAGARDRGRGGRESGGDRRANRGRGPPVSRRPAGPDGPFAAPFRAR